MVVRRILCAMMVLVGAALAQDKTKPQPDEESQLPDRERIRTEIREGSRAGTSSADLEEKKRVQRLIRKLEDTSRRVDRSGNMAKRSHEVLEKIKEFAEDEGLDYFQALEASGTVQKYLLNALDKLEDASREVEDEVRGSVLPSLEAMLEGMRARHEVSTNERIKKVLEEIIHEQTEENANVRAQVDRLKKNIGKLGAAKEAIEENMTILGLWSRARNKTKGLVEKLSKLNSEIERIHRQLVPMQ